jgi:hypothetical protein
VRRRLCPIGGVSASTPFHERFDFIASPTDAYHLILLMKDVRTLVGSK